MSVVHHDTDNVHIHVAINKIHPTTFTLHNPGYDYKTRSKLCELLEHELGLAQDNHQRGQTRGNDVMPKSGQESFQAWLQRHAQGFINAPSWEEFHGIAEAHGVRLDLRPFMPKSRLLAFVIKELREVVPPTVFFAVGFNLIVLTTDLILADYLVSFGSFMVATITALVVGKSVLVANAMPFLRRFDTAPMIKPVLFKTIVYWAVVFLVRFLEKLVEYLFAGGTLSGIPEYAATHFTWHRFAAIQIWIFVLFLIYTSVEELNARLGNGELMKIFFTRRSSIMKPTLQAADSRGPQARPANRDNK